MQVLISTKQYTSVSLWGWNGTQDFPLWFESEKLVTAVFGYNKNNFK